MGASLRLAARFLEFDLFLVLVDFRLDAGIIYYIYHIPT